METATNGELLEGFLTNCARRYLRPATLKAYRDRLSILVKDLDATPIAEADKNTIEEWLDRHSGCAQSRHSYRSTAILWFDWCVENDQLPKNAARLTARPRVPKGQPRPLPTRDVAVTMGQATPRMQAILALAAYAGLRCMEIAALGAGDVDLARRWLVVRDGKGGKQRTIPIHDELAAVLAALPLPSSGPVIANRQGKAFRPRSISVMVREHLRRLEVAGSAHRFRHWFATSIVEAGGELQDVKELLGHESLATTQIYVGWSLRRGRTAVDAIPRAG